MKTRLHINQHNIRANAKGADLPVITVKDYKQNRKCNSARVMQGEVEVFANDATADHQDVERPDTCAVQP